MTRKKRGFALKKLCYIADNDVMQRLYKNENLLFRDFQEFLSRKQHIPENRLPYYLRWISRFHEFCSRRNIDGNGQDSIAAYLLDLAKDHEDWQVQQAKEAVRLFRYFKAMQDTTPTEGGIDGTASWQLVEDEVIRALRLRHRSYRTEQSYLHWLRRFGSYMGFKEPQTVTQKDLEHLAKQMITLSTGNHQYHVCHKPSESGWR